MTRSSLSGWALVGAVLLIPLAGVWLALHDWYPRVLSSHGLGIKLMLDYTLAVTGAFFVVGHLVLAWLVIRALRSRQQSNPLASRRAQRLVGVVPALVMALVAEGGVMALGLPVWDQYYGEAPEDAVQIEIIGRQFFWTVRYPGPDRTFGPTETPLVSIDNPAGLDVSGAGGADDVVLLNEVHLPVGRPVEIRLRSYDVIHSFFVPELFLKQDLMPGMTIPVRLQATETGSFELACNQICGLGHYRMRGFVHVEEPAAFEAWLAQQAPFAEQQ